jgi:hypothetical protein
MSWQSVWPEPIAVAPPCKTPPGFGFLASNVCDEATTRPGNKLGEAMRGIRRDCAACQQKRQEAFSTRGDAKDLKGRVATAASNSRKAVASYRGLGGKPSRSRCLHCRASFLRLPALLRIRSEAIASRPGFANFSCVNLSHQFG